MRTALLAAALLVLLAAHGNAQTLPASLTKVGTYTPAMLGLTTGAGGIEFDSQGRTLYVNDPVADRVMAVSVVRNAAGRVTGFQSPSVLVASKSSTAGALDGGLATSPVGTLFFTNWSTAELEQYVPTTNAHTVTVLNLGVAGSPGGAEYLPRNGSLLVSNWDAGGIYELPLTLTSNLTYTLGQATKYLSTPAGVEGFAFVPTGPFDKDRGLVVVNYSSATVHLVAIDPTTSKPFVDAAGAAFFVPLITGLTQPMDVEFDPVTNDMFITSYSSTTAVLVQFAGDIRGGFDGVFDRFAPGCPQLGGTVPTLTASASLRVAQPITLRMTRAPANQSVAFLVFGIESAGNLGGFLFPGTSCRVYVNPMLSVPIPTDAAGIGSLSATIPTGALGVTLFSQGWALSTGANALNLTVSDAAVSRIAQ